METGCVVVGVGGWPATAPVENRGHTAQLIPAAQVKRPDKAETRYNAHVAPAPVNNRRHNDLAPAPVNNRRHTELAPAPVENRRHNSHAP